MSSPVACAFQYIYLIHLHIFLICLQYAQSGVVVLIMRLAQALYSDSSNEVLLILDLFSRIVTFNMVIDVIGYSRFLFFYFIFIIIDCNCFCFCSSCLFVLVALIAALDGTELNLFQHIILVIAL